jgi:hypothetical protein
MDESRTIEYFKWTFSIIRRSKYLLKRSKLQGTSELLIAVNLE